MQTKTNRAVTPVRRASLFLLHALLLVGLLISACRPREVVPATPEEASPLETQAVVSPSPTPQPVYSIRAVDDGSPLSPKVISHKPAGGEELPSSGAVELTFDQSMSKEQTESALEVQSEDGDRVPGSVSWSGDQTLLFRPSQALTPGDLYLVNLSSEAESAEGENLLQDFNFAFQVAGNLEVAQVFPADNAEDVESDALITVIFNRPVVPLVIAEQQAELPTPISIEPAVQGEGEWISTSVYAFRPDSLLGGTAYQVSIAAGLEDAAGDSSLEEPYAFTFTTRAPTVGALELTSGIYDPQDNYRGVHLQDGFRLYFHQPMNTASVEAAFSIRQGKGDPVPTESEWIEDATQVVFTPTLRLALETDYIMELASSAQAAGGGPLLEGKTLHFTTVPYPAITNVVPRNDTVQPRFENLFRISFVSPMDIESVKENVRITPALANGGSFWYDEWDEAMNIYGFEPSTTYQVEIGAEMTDIYGNPLREGRVVRFTTAAYPAQANLQMPYRPAMFRAGDDPTGQEFYARYININSLNLRLYRVDLSEFISLLEARPSPHEYVPRSEQLVWEVSGPVSASLNERVLQSYRPTMPGGGPLEPGYYFLTMNASPVDYQGLYLDTRLVVVANANLTFKSSSQDALLWLTDLESGEPISGAQLAVVDETFDSAIGNDKSGEEMGDLRTIAEGATSSDGTLYLSELSPPNYPYETRYAVSQDPNYVAFSSSDLDSGVNLYEYGLWAGYYRPIENIRAYIYTERPIYRPGHTVYFKGIVRTDEDLDYQQPPFESVHVRVESIQEVVFEETYDLTPFGTFSGEFVLDGQAALGYYNIVVTPVADSDTTLGSLNFTVAQYRRPEFQISVTTDREHVVIGDSFHVNVQADYFSGGGLAGGRARWTLSAEPFTFVPPGDDLGGFSFSDFDLDVWDRDWFEAGYGNVIAEGTATTDADGRLELVLPVEVEAAARSHRLTFEVNITDVGGSQVSGRASLMAHPSTVYVGIRSATYVGRAEQEQSFEVVVVDWVGKQVPELTVDVQIVERRWNSVQVQDASGRIRWEWSVEEIPVQRFEGVGLDGRGRAEVSYTPPNGGIFRAIAMTSDAEGNVARSSAFQWVAGEDYIPWRQTNDRSFQLVSDKDTYLPGETAEILIASPFQGSAVALVTVERGLVRYSDVIRLDTNSTIYELPITPDMAPNMYVSVVVVKGVDEFNAHPSYKMGVLPLNVDTREQELVVALEADRDQVGPREQVTFTVRTTDNDGNPVSAEVSLGLSDLATLSLVQPNSPNILAFFYNHRDLSVWTAVQLGLSIEDYNAEVAEGLVTGEGAGSGGGKGEDDFGIMDVREDFPDTAYWEAHANTNVDGYATAVVTLPDNLTTWRLDARAVTDDTRVGQSQMDIVSSKPLLVRPQTPRFFVVGDRAQLGAVLHNNTSKSMQVQVRLEAEGVALLGEAEHGIDIPANSQVYVSWDAQVNETQQDGSPLTRVDLVFRADGESASGETYNDATRPTLGTLEGQGIPVYRYESPEFVGTSGQLLDSGQIVEAVSLPPSMDVTEGNLTVKVDHSLAAGMAEGLTYLENFPYECIEQTVSRFLPNVVTVRAMQSAGVDDPTLTANLDEVVNLALQRLYNAQKPDGGWGWWGANESDRNTTAYAVLGLEEADRAGYSVSQPAMTRALHFLRTHLPSLRNIPSAGASERYNLRAFMLYVLAMAGQPDVSNTVQLYEDRMELSYYARAYLAHTLYSIDTADPRVPVLLSDLVSAAELSATGAHWEEEFRDYWNWNTDTRTTAIVLASITEIDPENPINANAVRWLMSNRQEGHWSTTQETAWSLMALANWSEASGEMQADYEFAIALNGEQLGGGAVNRDNIRNQTVLRVSVEELLITQANRLAFARSSGAGNLYYTAHMNLSLPVEQITTLDRGFTVSRSYYELDDDENTPVEQAAWGDMVLVRLTVVVPHDRHYVVIDDPLPAGLEAVDQGLETSEQAYVPEQFGYSDMYYKGWGWWHFDHVEMRDERVVISADYLPAGTYVYNYLARAATPGEYRVIPTTAREFYFPEVYGRGQGSLFTVLP